MREAGEADLCEQHTIHKLSDESLTACVCTGYRGERRRSALGDDDDVIDDDDTDDADDGSGGAVAAAAAAAPSSSFSCAAVAAAAVAGLAFSMLPGDLELRCSTLTSAPARAGGGRRSMGRVVMPAAAATPQSWCYWRNNMSAGWASRRLCDACRCTEAAARRTAGKVRRSKKWREARAGGSTRGIQTWRVCPATKFTAESLDASQHLDKAHQLSAGNPVGISGSMPVDGTSSDIAFRPAASSMGGGFGMCSPPGEADCGIRLDKFTGVVPILPPVDGQAARALALRTRRYTSGQAPMGR